MKWLVACFGPFGEARTNASALIHARLKNWDWAGRVVFADPLPVTFADAWPTFERHVKAHGEVQGLLTLGQAAGRRAIDLECLALNRIDTAIPDTSGVTPPLGPIAPDGPDLRWCRIPWERFNRSPLCARSYAAGTYVCNTLFYQSLGFAEAHNLYAGFVHIPALEIQSEFGSLPRLRVSDADAAVAEILRFLVEL